MSRPFGPFVVDIFHTKNEHESSHKLHWYYFAFKAGGRDHAKIGCSVLGPKEKGVRIMNE